MAMAAKISGRARQRRHEDDAPETRRGAAGRGRGRRSSPAVPVGSPGALRVGAAVGLGVRLFIATPRAGGAVGGSGAATGGSEGGRAPT